MCDKQIHIVHSSVTYKGRNASSFGNLCLGFQQGLVGIGAVEGSLEGHPPEAPGSPQLKQGLLAGSQCQHAMYKWPAPHTESHILSACLVTDFMLCVSTCDADLAEG